MSDNQYSISLANLINALEHRFPQAEPYEIEGVGNIIIEQVSQHVEAGDGIAF